MSPRMLIISVLFACFMCLSTYEAAAQQVTVQNDGSDLLAEPQSGAAVVAKLKKGTTGQQIGKQGMFVNLKTAAGTGWTFAFNVSLPPGGSGSASTGGGGRGPTLTGKPQVQATIGIRGLTPDEMRQAVTNPEQLKLLDSYVASAQDAEGAAAQSGLTAVRVNYFK